MLINLWEGITLRIALKWLYDTSSVLAAFCLVAIASLVSANVLLRIIDNGRTLFDLDRIGLQITSLDKYAGFLLIGASFLALAGTFRKNDHIRVTMLLQSVSPGFARILNKWSLFVAICLVAVLGYYALDLTLYYFDTKSVTDGVTAIYLYIPAAIMTFGLFVFLIALIDDLVVLVGGHAPSFELATKDDLIEGKE